MEIVIWILVIIAVIAVIVWLLRRNSQNGSGTDAGTDAPQRHPGHQPGSGSSDPVVETASPVSNTAAAGSAGTAAAAGVSSDPRGDGDYVSPDDPGFDERGTDGSASAPYRPGEHTTAHDDNVDESYESSLEQDDNASGGQNASGADGAGIAAQPRASEAAAAERSDGYVDTGGVDAGGTGTDANADAAAPSLENSDSAVTSDDTEGGSNPGAAKRPKR